MIQRVVIPPLTENAFETNVLNRFLFRQTNAIPSGTIGEFAAPLDLNQQNAAWKQESIHFLYPSILSGYNEMLPSKVPILLITDVFDRDTSVPQRCRRQLFNSLQRPLGAGKLHVKARNPIRPDATGTHSSKDRNLVMFAGYLYESPAVNIK